MMSKALDLIEEWMITFMMGGATLLIFFSVLHRYGSGFQIPYVQDWLISLNFSWAQELCIIMFVWMAKFGAAYGVRMGVHVGVDVLINRLPVEWRKAAVIISLACGIAFTAIIGTLGFRFIWEIGMHYAVYNFLGLSLEGLTSGPTTPDLDWPSWIIYSAVPYGSYLMCFRFVQVTVTYLRTGEMPRHDETKIEGIQAIEDDPEVAMPHGALANTRTDQLAVAGGVK
jgi:C4-dicarboxylate transporter DctQ subunit